MRKLGVFKKEDCLRNLSLIEHYLAMWETGFLDNLMSSLIRKKSICLPMCLVEAKKKQIDLSPVRCISEHYYDKHN
jgi:hypothetical protein